MIEVSYQDQGGYTYYIGTEQIKRASRAIVSHYPDEGTGSGFETILLGDIGTREQPGPFVDALFRLVEKVKARQTATERVIELGRRADVDYRLRIKDGKIKVEIQRKGGWLEGNWEESHNHGPAWDSWLEEMVRHPLVAMEQARHE